MCFRERETNKAQPPPRVLIWQDGFGAYQHQIGLPIFFFCFFTPVSKSRDHVEEPREKGSFSPCGHAAEDIERDSRCDFRRHRN